MNINPNNLNLKDIDNISVTAYRILSILNLLLEYPCSDKEINEKLQKDIIGARSLSQDTICIYINTLRAIGCEISRPSKSTDYKYVLTNYPFKIKLTEHEINALVKIQKYAFTIDNWKLNYKFDQLRKLFFERYYHPETIEKREIIEKSTFLRQRRTCQPQIIYALEKYCNKKSTLIINYNSPVSGEKLIEMSVDKINFENGSFYLWGYNLKFEETQYLRIDRIKEIQAINIKNSQHSQKNYSIKYKLTGISALTFTPNIDELIIDKNNNEIIIESKSKNKFKIIQKILTYGSNCTILSPEEIKIEVINKLKSTYIMYKEGTSF
ncbi:MAG: WYL domain-containing protein [Candidatus Gastranaerophilales bacterium]|nr:WYL domain-containing protein [Candidatus Gastranaerophilales bacterium]